MVDVCGCCVWLLCVGCCVLVVVLVVVCCVSCVVCGVWCVVCGVLWPWLAWAGMANRKPSRGATCSEMIILQSLEERRSGENFATCCELSSIEITAR